ncbi:helix-turn-helix transcriptional regulator [Polaribacter cellanae]|uniref:Helix-turn-helix transcriptional regulator n=1 Tax=Polaribacter cellanae TaxID=2818493 RepID=A0A975H7M6_9FLAO|nr:helix-turn-helix transcriptional regulator [Polaribacter cellanae]
MVDNKTNKEIAEALFISVNTVKYHVKNIYDKLNIKSRREAQNIAISL